MKQLKEGVSLNASQARYLEKLGSEAGDKYSEVIAKYIMKQFNLTPDDRFYEDLLWKLEKVL